MLSLSRFLGCLAIQSLLVSTAALDAQELKERECRELVQQFVDVATPLKRRTEILEALKQADPLLAQKPLSAVLGEKANPVDAAATKIRTTRRGHAIDLAVSLTVRGLFKVLKPEIDGENEDQITKLAFVTQDEGAIPFLLERWAKADPSSATYKYIEGGFRKYSLEDPNLVFRFQQFLRSPEEERKRSAMKILGFQLGVDPKVFEEPLVDWPRMKEDFLRETKAFTIEGESLSGLEKWQFTGDWQRRARNYKVQPRCKMILTPFPESMKTGSYTVRARMLPKSNGVTAWFGSASGAWKLEVKESQWVVRSSRSEGRTAAKLDEWTEVSFTVQDESKIEGEVKRIHMHVSISVDNKVLLERGSISGGPGWLSFEPNDGVILVGGIERIATPPPYFPHIADARLRQF